MKTKNSSVTTPTNGKAGRTKQKNRQKPAIESIKRQIERSRLLSPDRKKTLLEKLPEISPEQLTKLQNILNWEGELFAALSEKAISKAVDTANNEVLAVFEAFFTKTDKALAKAGEEGGGAAEKEQAEELLNNYDK